MGNELYLKVRNVDTDIVIEIINTPNSIYHRIRESLLNDPDIYIWFIFEEGIMFEEFELISLLNPLDIDLLSNYCKGCSLIEKVDYRNKDIFDVKELMDRILTIIERKTDMGIQVGYNYTYNRLSYGVKDKWITLNNDGKVEVVERPKIYFNTDKLIYTTSPKNIEVGDLILNEGEAGIIRFKRVNDSWILDEYVFEAVSIFTGEIYRIHLFSTDDVKIISQSSYMNLQEENDVDDEGEIEEMNYRRFEKKYKDSIPKRFGIEQLFSAQLLMDRYITDEIIDIETRHGFNKTANSVYFAIHGLISHLIDIGCSYSMITNLEKLKNRYKEETNRSSANLQLKFRDRPFSKKLYGDGKNNRFKDDIEFYYLDELQEVLYNRLQDKVHPIILLIFLGPDIKLKKKVRIVTEKDEKIYHHDKNSLLTFTAINENTGKIELLLINNVPKNIMRRVLLTSPEEGWDDFCNVDYNIDIRFSNRRYKVDKLVSRNSYKFEFHEYIPFIDYKEEKVKIKITSK